MVNIDDAMHYAAEDADIAYRLWEILRKELIKEKLFSFYFFI